MSRPNVICKIGRCGYNSVNGFCLNRLVVINENGICSYLTRPGWEQQIEDKYKNISAAPGPAEDETESQGLQEQLCGDLNGAAALQE